MSIYHVLNSKASDFISFSVFFHLFILILAACADMLNFQCSSEVMQASTQQTVRLHLGSIRNTRTKESDLAHKKALEIQKANQKALEEKAVKAAQEKKDSPPPAGIQPQTRANVNNSNRLELAKKNVPNAAQQQAQQVEEVSSVAKSSSKNNQYRYFDSVESFSNAPQASGGFRSIHDVVNFQFKKDLVEFFKNYWEYPDYLADEDIKIAVYIQFDKNGRILKYEIQHPKNNNGKVKAYKDLRESLQRLFLTIKNLRLPVNGRKLKSYQLNFEFHPQF